MPSRTGFVVGAGPAGPWEPIRQPVNATRKDNAAKAGIAWRILASFGDGADFTEAEVGLG